MKDNLHTVKRISIELETDRGTPFEERSKVLVAFQKELKRELEMVMDELCGSDEVIRIDQLKIDLGSIHNNDFGSLFIEEFRRKLKESIVRVQHEQAMSDNRQSEISSDVKDGQSVFRKSTEDRKFDAIIFFINKGGVPWWSPFESFSELESFMSILEKKPPLYLARLKNVLIDNDWARERFILTFPKSTVLSLVQTLFQSSFKKNISIIQLIEKFFIEQLPSNVDIREKRRMLLAMNHCISENTSVAKLVSDFILSHKLSFNEQERKEWLNKEAKKKEIQEWVKASGSSNVAVSTEEVYEHVINELSLTEDKKKLVETNKPEPELNIEINESVRLNYAGVVITWPMLKVLFEARELLKNGQFIDESKQHKALQLLNYLVSGEESLEEYEMPLNKLLCGIHPSFPMRFQDSLSEKDKTEVDELLDHIIVTWKELKNTSREGLRSSFIQRSAMLEERENSWFVKVEQSGIDILMGKIPWGYSMIKLPWMEKMIHVEW